MAGNTALMAPCMIDSSKSQKLCPPRRDDFHLGPETRALKSLKYPIGLTQITSHVLLVKWPQWHRKFYNLSECYSQILWPREPWCQRLNRLKSLSNFLLQNGKLCTNCLTENTPYNRNEHRVQHISAHHSHKLQDYRNMLFRDP